MRKQYHRIPKLTNETPSIQVSHTGHSDQLLNENDQVSDAEETRTPLQILAAPPSYTTECESASLQLQLSLQRRRPIKTLSG